MRLERAQRRAGLTACPLLLDSATRFFLSPFRFTGSHYTGRTAASTSKTRLTPPSTPCRSRVMKRKVTRFAKVERFEVKKQLILKNNLMRILLIEAEEEVANFIERGLRQERFAVDWAATAEKGLMLARVNAYDCVVLDINVSGKVDGLQALRDKGQQFPIIVLSAVRDPAVRIEALNMGAADYLTGYDADRQRPDHGYAHAYGDARRKADKTQPERIRIARIFHAKPRNIAHAEHDSRPRVGYGCRPIDEYSRCSCQLLAAET